MKQIDQDRAAEKIRLLADHNSWPMISDPRLRFATPQLQTVLDVWTAKRGTRRLPSRGDLTLRDVKVALPNIAFMNIVREGARLRFKVKLVGGELDRFVGGPITGRFLDEAVPVHFAEKWIALWLPAIEGRVPTRTVGRTEFADQRYYVCEALHAPLADDGETPDIFMLVAYFHFIPPEGAQHADLATRLMSEVGERAIA